MDMKQEDKFEKQIRFVAKHYREDKLDTDKAWQQFAATHRVPRRFALPRYLLAAASVILILLLARIGYVHISDTGNWIVVNTEPGQQRELLLPDSSRLLLAGGSSVRYDKKKYGKERRDVMMTGKVFYQVSRDESRPFSVQTVSTVVTVLGTGFQVDEVPGSVTVYVESGKVSFAADESEAVVLTAGMQAVYEEAGEKIELLAGENTNILAWKTRQLRFDHTPLHEVVHDLEVYYQVHIINRSATGDDPELTAAFDDLPLEDVLQVINHTLDVHLVPGK
ncbi:MAG: FecR domain-containing protein [Tannerellaceae bacterium]|nr:FecR domain-containing protein [Tannerellaceae bacterium]